MHLSLTTFLIEIANFFLLLWILWKLLVKPVRRIIADRREAVAKILEESKRDKTLAEELRKNFEDRLKNWNTEKEVARKEFHASLEEERSRAVEKLSADLEQERERFRVREEREAQEKRAGIEKQAMGQAFEFVSRFLKSLSSAEIEARIFDLFLARLLSPEGEFSKIVGENFRELGKVTVWSAYPLPGPRQDSLRKALSDRLGHTPEFTFAIDPSLVAGVKIDLGLLELRANIQDELRYFSERGEA